MEHQSRESKTGTVFFLHPRIFWGKVIEDETREQFFFYPTDIVSNVVPMVGSRVEFRVSPLPPKPGKLRIATKVAVVDGAAFTESVKSAGAR